CCCADNSERHRSRRLTNVFFPLPSPASAWPATMAFVVPNTRGMELIITDLGFSYDLSAVVDAVGSTICSAECAEVLHPATAGPEEGVLGVTNNSALSHDLPHVVYADGLTEWAVEHAEVLHPAAAGPEIGTFGTT
ncbi:MAG: hypothetical protein ABFC96_16355, partial [Thermoguttaceae bacterium]